LHSCTAVQPAFIFYYADAKLKAPAAVLSRIFYLHSNRMIFK